MRHRFASSFPWISRDARLIISARGVRTFAQGFLAVLLALYLDQLGFSLVQIGAFFSATVAGSALFAFIVSLAAAKAGRRRLLVTFAFVSAASGLVLFFEESFLPLLVLAFLGNLIAAAAGPMQPLEQASLSDTVADKKRTDLFAIYGVIATSGAALGALAAGLPELFQDAFGMSTISSYKIMFVGFSVIQLIGALLYSLLSSAVEGGATSGQWVNPLRLPSRRRIFTLTGLFSVDHFAGSLIVQSLVAYWFTTKFGIELQSLSFIFFMSHTLTAISLWLAAKIANRIGVLNTMVFTHIVASVFLMAVAFSPLGWMAVVFWQLRSFFGSMDIPTRDSYTMAVVTPDERVAMASINIVGRSILGTAGPSVATALWEGLSATAPFVACGALKISYDVTLYFTFRNVKPPEEAQRIKARAEKYRPSITPRKP